MIYRLGECTYCSNSYSITRPTPYMADVPAMMCKGCWDMTQKENKNCNDEDIGDFGNSDGYKEICKTELEEISKVIDEQKSMADILIVVEDKEDYEIVKILGWLESLYSYKYMEMESGK